ncbi:MAG: hypothetical protein JWN40_3030 [Phycisphaerales bacterium]|nr:hypothetical protein [Phycisphaerales bacterium]
MFQTGTFWLILLGSVVVYWILPARVRLAFLACVSGVYVAVQSPWNATALLGWSMLFFWLTPLSRRRRRPETIVAIAPAMAAVREHAAVGAGSDEAIDAPSTAMAQPEATNRDDRWILWALIGGILAYLALFKYILPEFTPTNRLGTQDYLIPLGISYFTFKFIHYSIETARGNIRQHSLGTFLCYVFLFPTFGAGPIERFDHFIARRAGQWRSEMAIQGLTRIIHGLIKKFVFAEMLFADAFRTPIFGFGARPLSAFSTTGLWGVAIASYLYVYLEFSGYCDVAIGASRLFGLEIMENFNFPFLAPNLGEFWKRWHMTLTGWCQSYVYMPVLGLWRHPMLATYAAFVAIGLWHSASPPWIAWGLYHATGIFIYQAWVKTKRKHKWVWVQRWPVWLAGVAVTTLFVSAGDLITFGGGRNTAQTVQLFAKLLFIDMH